ncbi:MAG: pyrroline-5-carboxylate reductase [Rhodospirillaceae bacterium]|nr:pyrroline-5-carboxylate reductase [Rhodospirillaceae bacterium]
MDYRLLLIGCGKMGGALLSGWLARGIAGRIDVVEPAWDRLPEGLAGDGRVHLCPAGAAWEAGPPPHAVVLAVKPQAMDAVVPDYAPLARRGTLFLSIAAGKTIAYFRRLLGPDARIVRAMPNTPAAVAKGISVLAAGPEVDPGSRRLCDALMQAVGQVEWVDDEAAMDAVTALSGGGPAYVFLLIETLAAAGRAAGLDAGLAMRLARQTVVGAAALADASDDDAATLRRNVTSPGGTTAEALRVLMADDGVQPLFDRAIAAATARSRELAG